MYTLSIPIMIDFSGKRRAQYLEELSRAKPDRIFLCPCRSCDSAEEKNKALEILTREVPFFQGLGYEVGIWISSLGHGGSSELHPEYQNIINANGKFATDSYCPLDKAFTDEFADWIKALAKTGPSLIMLDDDYRLGYRSGIGCFCPHHLAKVSAMLGEKIDRETLVQRALSGRPSKYRDAWMKANGDSLLSLAEKLRAALDTVDPAIRLGHCAVLDTWDIDGVDSIALAKAFAGNTRPFLRLIGAAYWAQNRGFGGRIQQIIEVERMQSAWCEKEDIEVFAEGDVFPRPRHNVPAFYLEALDTALRADGTTDGILKYMIDYSCVPFYERGYIDRHVANSKTYREISRIFDNKEPVGVRIYDCMHRLKDAELPEPYASDQYVSDDFMPASVQLMGDAGIPMQHTREDVTVVFGENARHIPEHLLYNGAILDAVAARILTERGIDVGLLGVGKAFPAKSVHYPVQEETLSVSRMGIPDGPAYYILEPKDGAESVCEYIGPNESSFAYRYEDTAGRRFLVFPFEGKQVRTVSLIFRNYCMQSLLLAQIEWIRRRPLDATLAGHPDTYLLCKKDASSLSVGIWNMFPDPVLSPEILLGETWSRAEFIGCEGTLSENKVSLSELEPFSFAFVVMHK